MEEVRLSITVEQREMEAMSVLTEVAWVEQGDYEFLSFIRKTTIEPM